MLFGGLGRRHRRRSLPCPGTSQEGPPVVSGVSLFPGVRSGSRVLMLSTGLFPRVDLGFPPGRRETPRWKFGHAFTF